MDHGVIFDSKFSKALVEGRRNNDVSSYENRVATLLCVELGKDNRIDHFRVDVQSTAIIATVHFTDDTFVTMISTPAGTTYTVVYPSGVVKVISSTDLPPIHLN